jgi:hypothetical protein
MNVFNADDVDEIGEEERKGGFACRTSCTRLFESIRMPPVDDDQLVRKRVQTLGAKLSRLETRFRVERVAAWCE